MNAFRNRAKGRAARRAGCETRAQARGLSRRQNRPSASPRGQGAAHAQHEKRRMHSPYRRGALERSRCARLCSRRLDPGRAKQALAVAVGPANVLRSMHGHPSTKGWRHMKAGKHPDRRREQLDGRGRVALLALMAAFATAPEHRLAPAIGRLRGAKHDPRRIGPVKRARRRVAPKLLDGQRRCFFTLGRTRLRPLHLNGRRRRHHNTLAVGRLRHGRKPKAGKDAANERAKHGRRLAAPFESGKPRAAEFLPHRGSAAHVETAGPGVGGKMG